jgi:hypothetical protein
MATHDQNIANQSASAVRADINSALAAIFTNSSSASPGPTTTVAYQWWVDTTNNQLKQRNAANSGWITWGTIGATLSITGTNVSPNFGSQNIVTTGTCSATAGVFVGTNYAMSLSGGNPVLTFDTNDFLAYDRTANFAYISIGGVLRYAFYSTQFIAEPAYTVTTASAANVVVVSNGQFSRSTSARKYKRDIEDLPIEESVEIVNQLQPITYSSLSDADPIDGRYLGFIADDVLPIDQRLVSMSPDGEPEGFEYTRLTAHLVNYCRHLEQRIAALEA